VAPLRTRIYIDGYNLYYGCLRNTPYKWLDVFKLFERSILPSILYRANPTAEPSTFLLHPECAVKYFTAKILERAARSEDSVSSQAHYHNALQKHCVGRVDFVLGNYSVYKSNQGLVDKDNPKCLPRDCPKVEVWKFEEKQSDVNLALQVYDDALSGDIDHVVLVTNDTDLAPALDILKKRCPHIVRGVVIPTRKSENDNQNERQANASLTNLADWVRTYISQDELAVSQLPDVVAGNRRASTRPHSWYAKPHHLATMIDMAKPVLGTNGAIMKWARTKSHFFDDRCPIDLIATDDGAQIVFDYITKFVSNKT
jgi:uncharacterized LabA/DUF88 family protein